MVLGSLLALHITKHSETLARKEEVSDMMCWK